MTLDDFIQDHLQIVQQGYLAENDTRLVIALGRDNSKLYPLASHLVKLRVNYCKAATRETLKAFGYPYSEDVHKAAYLRLIGFYEAALSYLFGGISEKDYILALKAETSQNKRFLILAIRNLNKEIFKTYKKEGLVFWDIASTIATEALKSETPGCFREIYDRPGDISDGGGRRGKV